MTQENAIEVQLTRDSGGLRLRIKTHPRVEKFMAAMGAGLDPVDPALYHRYWIGDKPLMVYPQTPENIVKLTRINDGLSYRLDHVGGPIIQDGRAGGGGPMVINAAFLRLVGTSLESGVTFRVRGVFSTDMIEALENQIAMVCQHFYTNFMKPINVIVGIYTQEVK